MQITWDEGRGAVKGLHLRMKEDGKTGSFLFYYRTKAKRQRRPKVGSYPEINWAEARRRAGILAARVAIGEDPKGDWDAAKGELTLRALYDRVLKEYWSQERFVVSRHKRVVENLWKNHIEPKLGSMLLSAVTPLVVRNWHAKLAHIPYGANRSLEVLRRLFSFAEEQELRPGGSNPCTTTEKFVEISRERVASREEQRSIAKVLLRELEAGRTVEVAFLVILTYTGARPISIFRAQWHQIQIEDGVGFYRFPGKSTAKTGKPELVVFPPPAVEALSWIPRGKPTDLVIPLPRWKVERWWRALKAEVGCPDLWIYDLRRTFASVAFNSGETKGIVGHLLNHASEETTNTYARLETQVRVSAAVRTGERIKQIVQQEEEDPYS